MPRWATRAAHLVALTTLPSALWRLPLAFGLSMGMVEPTGAPVHVSGWESVYVIGLSLVSEAAALLTLGLVKPWGERAPGWIPVIGGRRIPPMAVIVPAAIGALLLAFIWGYAFRDFPEMGFSRDQPPGLEGPDLRRLHTAAGVGAAAGRGHLRLLPAALPRRLRADRSRRLAA